MAFTKTWVNTPDDSELDGHKIANQEQSETRDGETVDVLYQEVIVAVQPAREAAADAITAKLATDAIQNGLTALTPKFAHANVTASQTDSSVVAAVSSKKIRVLCFRVHGGGTATTVVFNSKPGGAGSAISETFACGANGGHHGAFCPVGHFETASGEGLSVTTGAGATTGIGVVYVEV